MLTVFADAELGRCLATRRSYYCVVITVLNVVVFFKICKSTTVQPHTTASEINASYKGIRYLEPVRTIFAFSGHQLAKPSDLYTDNSVVQAVVESDCMTTRCRHLDIPIAFLHESKANIFEPKQNKVLGRLRLTLTYRPVGMFSLLFICSLSILKAFWHVVVIQYAMNN